MDAILGMLTSFSDFIWDWPMSVVLVGTGIFLSIIFKFSYQLKIGFHFKNTFAKMFSKGEGEGSVSGFAAACTAMANTIGIGNIGGVATAITSGGPGAVFWMWVSGFFGMSTKAAEIILGQRYRVKYDSMDEYVCDRSFVMKNAMGWKMGGAIIAVFVFIFGPWTNLVQSQAFSSSLFEAFGWNETLSLALLGISVLAVIYGGLQRIASIVEKMVPFMAAAYIIGGIAILVMHIDKVPATFALIFRSAFSPTAAVGGFMGATVKDTIRYGIARGLYSNDAGTGYGIVAHAAAQSDHPIRQSSWGWGEVFVDTIVICTITALSILLTNSYIDFPDVTSGQLTTVAFRVAFGNIGAVFLALAIALFVWTTIVGMYYSCEKAVNYIFGDSKINKIATKLYMAYFLIPVVFFANLDVDLLWTVTDLITASYVVVTLILIFGRLKEIRRLYDDFWNRFMPAIERGEKPEPVTFETVEDRSK